MSLDEVMLAQLKDLKKKRGIVKAALTRMKTFVESFDPAVEAISLLEFRQEELPRINQKFDDIQTQIELIMVDDIDKEEEERGRFENEFFKIRSTIQEIINTKKVFNNSTHNSTLNMSTTHARVQLPPIKLPEFHGNIQDWESYYDCFRSMVHEDNNLAPAHKFYYLRASVFGAALDLIKTVPMTDANYDVAMMRLKQRYDNRSLTIQSHIRSLLESPYVESATATQLQQLHSHLCTHVAALKALDQPVERWDAWLITIVCMRLDKETSHGWQLHQRNTQLPKYIDIEEFLASRCVALQNSYTYLAKPKELEEENLPPKQPGLKKNIGATAGKRVLAAATRACAEESCVCCLEPHRLYQCDKFKEMSPSKRVTLVREKRLCFNCLSPYHRVDACRSKFVCQKCKRRHNTLMHYEKQEASKETPEGAEENVGEVASSKETTRAAMMAHHQSAHVFLATAIVLVTDNLGRQRECRVVLDSGSQVNFMSKKLANLLKLPTKRASLPISGIGCIESRSTSYLEVSVQSRTSEYQLKLVCYVLPNMVTDLASCAEPKEGWKIPDELSRDLADPQFYQRRSVDLLIGGGVFFDIIGSERKMIGTGPLSLQDSALGWIVTGELGVNCLLGTNSLGEAMENSWRTELVNDCPNFGQASKSNRKSLEEQEVVEHFKQNTIRDNEGRFVVRLPVKPSISELGSTLAMAKSRYLNIERRLQRDEDLRKEYTQFMQEYITLGHMKEATEGIFNHHIDCYLPHHAIVKASSLTTKVRVVFDASARSSTGLSLNEVLKCGPTVQQELLSILTRFRKHQIVITGDVEKMFRQIKVAKEDWGLQKVLWRSSPEEELREYYLTTVTYGTTSASFLAIYCLVTLAKSTEQSHPKASKAIFEDFYMDDIMTGAETEEECCQLHRDISMIMDSAKLPLRKWCSNSEFVRQKLSEHGESPLFALDIGDQDLVKSLGLQWQPVADEFQFKITPRENKGHLTKRMILAELNRIFDPLGFLSPVLIKGKIFLQQLWAMKVEWDTKLPNEVQEKWRQFYKELEHLETIRIPRKVRPEISNVTEIHGFCDASEEAFGASVYVRSRDNKGNWHSRLLCSKTRVAPLRNITIPRLELNGALLLAQLVQKVAQSWEMSPKSFKLWTDSTIVLGWLNSQNIRLKAYVSNRVTQILDLSEATQWNHVKSEENPADICSRGLRPRQMQETVLWWNGPGWLSADNETWKNSSVQPQYEDELPEQRPIQLVLSTIDASRDLLNRYSDWRRLARAVAWLRRFVEYLRLRRKASWSQHLTVQELHEAKRVLIKRAQAEEFGKEVIALKNGIEVPHKSRLRSLCPYIDNGLILVGGRLQNATVSKEQQNPIVLPPDHLITRLIYKDCHHRMLHCGPQALLAEVRRTYWPTRGRAIARSVVRQCVICKRARPTFDQPIMGSLPKQRVQHSRPFTTTGVDFAGPLIIRSGIRGRPGKKAWIAIFVCFSTRAVHIEAVEDLTANAFLAAFRRFISRRGKPSMVWSDNGTNFIGARKELAVYVTKVDGCLASEGITWKFNPPAAPHFGGIWESAVKSAKFHLTRVVRGISLTLSELQTLLCQIEACLNCRPLTPMSSDPNDLEPITPAHFLIGGPLMFHPEPVVEEKEITALKRWKLVQGLLQSFWNRWYTEYIPQLQIRQKWTSGSRPLAVNDVVIIKEENLAPTRWKLARVVKVHPGKDNVVRVATVKLANGSDLTRPVVKLCRLPIEQTDSVEKINFQRGENVAA